MADTSIDRLTLDIVVNNDNATRRINSVTKAIEKLNTAVSKSGNLDKVLGTLNNVSPITVSSGGGGGSTRNKNKNWSEATYSIDKYGKKVLSQITTVAKFNGATSQSTKYFDEQGKQIREVINEIDQYGNKVKQVMNMTDKKQPKGGGSSGGGMLKNLNIFSTLGKWNYYINMARHYGKALAQTVQYAMDYVETQNLWQVANRNNLEMADEFIQKMNKAYGISEQTLMNYQAIFKNMLSALGGISEEISSGLSMQLTQMAVDFSSLYNVAIPDAMTKFQAILSGQVRPIRSVSGYDITENTIFDLYKKAGGEKSMRQLSQLEKRLLRIVAVFEQMDETGALGDMEKTIESASNQSRIMSEQFKEVATWTGQILLMGMNSTGLLQKVNAFLMTTKEIMKSIAYDLGYEEENFLDGLMTSAKGADEALDEIQGKLLSFDKFEALNSADNNVLGIDQNVLNLLEGINLQMSEYEMQATRISEKWLETLGFIDTNGDGIREMTGDAKEIAKLFKSVSELIESVISMIGSTFAAMQPLLPYISKLVGLLAKAYGWLAEHKLILSWMVSTFMGPFMLIGQITERIGGWIEKIKNALKSIGNGMKNFFKNFVGGKLLMPAYATGGFPEDGMFYANSGELVGQFSNGKTAVANNEQIVQGITQGVYTAMMAYNAQTSRQGGNGDVYLDGKKVGKVVAKSSHKEMVRTGLVSVNA